MRRRYRDCLRSDGNCTLCERAKDMHDCRGELISPLGWARIAAGLSIKDLSEKSGVTYSAIAKIETGVINAGNLTARNLLSLADALGVDPRTLI